MMEEYNALMQAYVNLSIEDKREEIIEKLKELTAIMHKFVSDMEIETEVLLNREIIDLKKEPLSEADFLEGTYGYINALEDMIGKYIDKIVDISYE